MKVLRKLWTLLREASGETDYARYCAHLRARHPGRPLPTQEQFYLDQLARKYAKLSRCC